MIPAHADRGRSIKNVVGNKKIRKKLGKPAQMSWFFKKTINLTISLGNFSFLHPILRDIYRSKMGFF